MAGSTLAILGGGLAAALLIIAPWLALALGVGTLGVLLRRGIGRRGSSAVVDGDLRRRRAVLAQYWALERLLQRLGFAPRQGAQTPREYMALVGALLGSSPDLDALTTAAEQAAYSSAPCPPDLPKQAAATLQRLARQLPAKLT
jgi:hypothetical protein